MLIKTKNLQGSHREQESVYPSLSHTDTIVQRNCGCSHPVTPKLLWAAAPMSVNKSFKPALPLSLYSEFP